MKQRDWLSDCLYNSFSVLWHWKQEQLSCHSGYTLAQYSGHDASGILLWETLRGSVQKVELKSELVGQNASIKQRWMFEGLIFSFSFSNGKWF